MSEMKFRFSINKTAAIRKGLKEFGTVTKAFDLSAASQEDRDLIAEHAVPVGNDETAALDLREPGNRYGLSADGDTLADVLEAIRTSLRANAERESKMKAAENALVAELEAEDAETLRTGRSDTRTTHRSHPTEPTRTVYFHDLYSRYAPPEVKVRLTTRNSPEWTAANDALFAQAVERRDAEVKAEADKKAEAERTKKEREEKAAAEIAEWAEKYGSERLKACVKNGWECRAIYRDERLALEYPGWAWDTIIDEKVEVDEPRNPTEEAVALFAEARAKVPEGKGDDVELVFWKAEETTDDYGDPVDGGSGYYCHVNPGEWASHYAAYGYTGPTEE